MRFCLWSATVAGTGRDSVFQVCVLLSLVLKLDAKPLVYLVSQTEWTLPLRAPAETVEFALRTVKNLSVNQTLSQPTKCVQFKPHKAPEHTKLQAASYGEVS